MRRAEDEKPVLVLGGTGKTGRRVAERLEARGMPVRIGSRSGEPPFDWTDRATWWPVLDGARAVYVSYPPDLAVPGAVEVASSFAKRAVAVAALTDDRHIGRLYELTGARSLTMARAAEEIAAAAGRNVRYVPISLEEHAAESLAGGVPPEVVDLLTYLFREVLDDRNAGTTDDLKRVPGHEPLDFADYAQAAAASGVWNSPQRSAA